MKKISSLILCSLFTLISFSVSAQGDAQAKAILDKVSAKVKALKSLKANFSITISSPKGKPQTKKGSVMMKGSAQYAEQRGFRGNSKSIFDAKSCEVKHLLYMMDGGEEFIFRDLFIKAKIVKRRLVLELDRQTLESRKWHEYEFSDEFRMKYSKSASSSCSPQE